MSRSASLWLLALVGAVACTTNPPYQTPFEATRVTSSGGQLAVYQVIVLFDSSGSIDPQTQFPSQKATLEAFVAGMPDGSYDADIVAFGGVTRDDVGLGDFDRTQLAATARNLDYIGEDTPLEAVLNETADKLAGRKGTAAVVIVSDGLPTIRGTGRPPEPTVEAAQEIVKRHDGPVCFHTVQVGSYDAGAALLQQISGLTDCGSFRNASEIEDTAPLYAFEREIFLGGALPAVAAAPPAGAGDADGDGVLDASDLCPKTPAGAKTDANGCWKMSQVRFASNSSAIPADVASEIDGIASVMAANPDLRLRIEGHTDATGPSGWNQGLSQLRADAARRALVKQGVSGDRIVAEGFGESNPVAPNSTAEGRAENRRIEFKAAN